MKTKKINTYTPAVSTVGAKMIGFDAEGRTKSFLVSDLVGSAKGLALPETMPEAPKLGDNYEATPGATYPNFLGIDGNPISIPTEINDKPVLTSKLLYDSGHWNAVFIGAEISLVDYPKNSELDFKTLPITFNPFAEGYQPEVVTYGSVVAVSNMPYSEGNAIKVPLGESANPSYVLPIVHWKNDLHLIRGKKLRFEVLAEGNIDIVKNQFVSSIRPIQGNNSYVGVSAIDIIQVTSKRVKFVLECVVGDGDVYYDAVYQFVNPLGGNLTYPNELILKTVSTSVFVVSEGKDQSYTLNKIITDAFNDLTGAISQRFKSFGPYLKLGGTSQFATINGGNPAVYNYVENGAVSRRSGEPAYQYIKPEFRFWNIIMQMLGKSYTVLDDSIGGSRLGTGLGKGVLGFNDEMSHFNMLGDWNPEATGIVMLEPGWNDNVEPLFVERNNAAENDKPAKQLIINEFFERYQNAVLACIARILIDNYAGIAWVGWDRSGNQKSNLWEIYDENNNVVNSGTLVDGSNSSQHGEAANGYFSAFRRTGFETAVRYFTRLIAGYSVEFYMENKRSVMLFFETGSDGINIGYSRGAKFNVLVNGVVKGTYTTNYTNPAIPTDFYPMVIWMDNLPAGAMIKIVNIDSNDNDGAKAIVKFQAYGWINKPDTSISDKKMVVIGSTSGNPFGHSMEQLKGFADCNRGAVACVNEHRDVYYCNKSKSFVSFTDQQPDDVSHVTAVGYAKYAIDYLNNLEKPNELGNSRYMIKDFN